MIKVNWKHAIIGVLIGVLITLFIRGELKEREAFSVQNQETGFEE
jgi:uncharacterized membrane-anchored protein YhcB (DUF1043 family)